MCDFPAARLLATRRLMAESKTIPLHTATVTIQAIDEARHSHQEKTGCDCWMDAIHAANQREMVLPERMSA